MVTRSTVHDAVERARRVQDARMDTVRQLADARQHLTDTREQAAKMVADAERVDLRAYQAALNAGWSPDELKKIGFPEPVKRTRGRRRTSQTPTPDPTPTPPSEVPADSDSQPPPAPVDPLTPAGVDQ